MENEPAPAEVRRVLGRPIGLGSPRSLIALSRPAFRWMLAAGLLIRIFTLALPGTGDVEVWKIWSYGASEDVTALYGVGGTPPERGVVHWGEQSTTVDYPPGALYGLSLVGRVYRLIDRTYKDRPALTVTIKGFILLLDAVVAWAVFALAGRWTSPGGARFAAAIYWLNPAALMDGAVLGYLDPWMGAAAVAALACAAGGLGAVAGVCLALAVLLKAQGVFIAPVVALLLWHSSGDRRRSLSAMVAAATATLAAGVLPFAVRGALPNLRQGLSSLLHHDMLSGTAANFWWVVTWVLRARDEIEALGPWKAWLIEVRILPISSFVALGFPNPRPIGSALVLAVGAWALWRAHAAVRRGAAAVLIVAAGAFVLHAYFVLGAQVHENHLYLAIPLLAAAAACDARFQNVFIAVSAIFALNLFFFYGVGRGFPLPPRGFTGVDVTVILAIANVAALAWHARVLSVVAQGKQARQT